MPRSVSELLLRAIADRSHAEVRPVPFEHSASWDLSRSCMAVALSALLAGCAHFHAQPIEPARMEAEFRARSLADEGLRAYAEGNRAHGPMPWPPATWDLPALTLVAFYYHPDLDLARGAVESADARIETAGARPNPVLAFAPQYTTNTEAGMTPWTLGFSLDVPIETAGKRGHRVAQAQHLGEAARLSLASVAWQVRSRVRSALAEHLLAQDELGALRAEAAARCEAALLIERRLAVGAVSRPDLDVARGALASTSLALRSAEGRLGETRAALAAALGVPTSALEGVTFAWPELLLPPGADAMTKEAVHEAGLVNRVDLRRALEEYAAAEARLRLEIAKQYPDLHLRPGFDSDQGEHQPGLGLSVELPILNQNQGPIAEAEVGRREARARVLGLQARILGETDTALARYRSAAGELGEADHLVAALDAQVAAGERALALGAADRLALAGLEVQRATAVRARLGALASTQAALGALEDAIQRPLASEPITPELPQASARAQETR